MNINFENLKAFVSTALADVKIYWA